MSYQTTEELNIIKTYSDIIFKGEWSILPIEIFIEYLRRICMNNLYKEAHQYLERERIYKIGYDEFDEEEDEEGESTIRLNNILLTQLEKLKNNGIEKVKKIEYEEIGEYGDEKENFAVIFMVDVKFI